MSENSPDNAPNAFEVVKTGSLGRTRSENKIETLRGEGGIFVAAVRATRMPMAVTDPSLPGNPIIFANEAFLRLSGYSMEEVLGQQPHFMNGAGTDPADAAAFRGAQDEDRDEVIESVQYRKDGSRFVAAVFLSAFKDEGGRTLNQFLSYLDVTDRVTAQSELATSQAKEARSREAEAQARALQEASSEVRYRMSADWTEMRELTGDSFLAHVDEPSTSWLSSFITETDQPRVMAAIKEAIGGKTLFDLEHQVRLKDGSIGWAHSRAVPILGQDGEIREWFGAANDITERYEAKERLRLSEARLAAAFESVPIGIAVVDLNGASVFANDGYRRFLPTGIIPSQDPERGGRWRAWDAEGQVLAPASYPGARALRGERVVSGQEMLYTNDDGREIWTSVAAVPIHDEAGRITGQISVISDIDARKRATEGLRKSEERLRQFGEASQDILWMRDAATFQWEYLTPAFETIYGLDREAALRGDNMSNWLELVLPSDRELAAGSLARVRRGEWVTFEYRIQRPDGVVRWLRDTDFPIIDEAGTVAHIGGICHDVTELKAIEDQLRRSEERLRLAQDAARVGMWDWDITTDEVSWSDEHFRLEGYAIGEVKPSYEAWLHRIHPDDQASAEKVLQTAKLGHLPYKDEFRSLHPDGRILWLSAVGTFFYDVQGEPVRMIGTVQDVTERREWQEHQKVLVGELQHRTRNLIGVVRSMVDNTGRSSVDFQDFRARFRDRLDALARAQGLLSRLGDQDRVTFDELMDSEMAAMDGSAGHMTLEGPKGVRLRSSMVQTLAMALHELATNAIKYGALGQPPGKVAVTWSVEVQGPTDQPWLHIDWRETGVSMALPDGKPRGSGQGRELIERALPYQLSAKTTYDIGPDGVHCTISIPVSTSKSSGE